MSHRSPRCTAAQRGVTLVELMVGMLIGMLAILVISQVLLVSEGQKRTTTSGADAQVNGALSLFTIQRDIQAAGYGFTSSPGIIGCPLSARYNNGGAAPVGFPAVLAPLTITPEAARPAGSVGDSIRILSSSKTSYAVPTRVVPPGIAVAGQSVAVAAALGFAVGDMAVVAADGVQPCWVFEVTAGLTATQLPRVDNARWNTGGTPTQAYGDGSVVLNLGTLIDNRYEINIVNGVNVLQVSSFDSANPTVRITRDVQAGVVGLLAYYGRDTSAPIDGIVDVYDTTTPGNNADWLRVMSVRLLVVSRSGQYEKDIVTPANPSWEVGATPPTTGSAACGASQCVTIDVGADAAGDVEAKHYRYKVFETIVPLRNMMWSS